MPYTSTSHRVRILLLPGKATKRYLPVPMQSTRTSYGDVSGAVPPVEHLKFALYDEASSPIHTSNPSSLSEQQFPRFHILTDMTDCVLSRSTIHQGLFSVLVCVQAFVLASTAFEESQVDPVT